MGSMMIMTVWCSCATPWPCPQVSVSGKEVCGCDHPVWFLSDAIDRWKKILEIKHGFEKKIGCSVYDLLPGVWRTVSNSRRE